MGCTKSTFRFFYPYLTVCWLLLCAYEQLVRLGCWSLKLLVWILKCVVLYRLLYFCSGINIYSTYDMSNYTVYVPSYIVVEVRHVQLVCFSSLYESCTEDPSRTKKNLSWKPCSSQWYFKICWRCLALWLT